MTEGERNVKVGVGPWSGENNSVQVGDYTASPCSSDSVR